MIDFSPKQKVVWKNTIQSRHRWNISVGATRSGKTHLDYYKIPQRIRNAKGNGLILLLGNTKGTLERNILDPMRQIWTPALVGNIGSNNKVSLFGRECWALGADKVNAVERVQGMGLEYCYGDEVPTWSEAVFQMIKSRLDKPGACFDGTGNPDHPKHWFKQFLDSSFDTYQMSFTIDDNPFLDPVFVENLKREYFGTVFYDRFILGRWVAAEGVIYRQFANEPERFIVDNAPDNIIFCTIGVDFGGSASAHAFNCTGYTSNFEKIVTLDEFYSKKEFTPAELEIEFVEFVKKQQAKWKVTEVFGDSAEQVLLRGFRNALIKAGVGVPVRDAIKGTVIDRIRLYTMLMGRDKYKIVKHCKNTIDAFSMAVWNSKKLFDERLDDGTSNIDSLDAQEYSTEKYQTKLIDLMMLGG